MESIVRKKNRVVKPWIRFLKRTLAVAVLLGLTVIAVLFGALIVVTKNVRSEIGTLEDKLVVNENQPSVIVSSDGTELLRLVSEYRKPFQLEDVPPHVVNAFIAAEDRRFYQHEGVDYIGLGRALVLAAREGKVSQGGSTITMQLAKQLLTGSDRTFDRKLKDIILANELESLKTKDQIMELYLKQVYFGEGAFGLASAAEVFFKKDVKDLTIAEAAMLARCVRRPTFENPVARYSRALANKNVVLGIMKEEGMINEGELQRAKAERPKIYGQTFRKSLQNSIAPYFVDYVLSELKESYPELDLKTGGYRIETTLNLKLQQFADASVRGVVNDFRRQGVTNGAFVLMDRNGHLLAIVGGQDYSKSQFNIATIGMRQPGSSFKPIVYSTALATGSVRPGQSLSNAPVKVINGRPWPKNSGKFNGPSYSIDTSIAMSINRPAVHTFLDAGKENVVQYAQDVFGLKSPLRDGGSIPDSLALGAMPVKPVEMAEVYSVFMLGGDRVHPTPIRRILGPNQEVIKEDRPLKFERVLPTWVAETMDGYLGQVVNHGTARAAMAVPDSRGKTGTTNSNKDAWFCGYTPDYVGIAWVGNLRGKAMGAKVFGGTVAIRFWVDIVNHARATVKPPDKLPPSDFTVTTGPGPKVKTVPPPTTAPEKPKADESDIEDPTVADSPRTEVNPSEQPVDPDGDAGAVPTTAGGPVPFDEPTHSAPPTERPKPRSTPPKRTQTDTFVEIEVCADTGERASLYCPNTVTRRFATGKAPRSICHEHRRGG
jgi:penicillin-binding protein 1A